MTGYMSQVSLSFNLRGYMFNLECQLRECSFKLICASGSLMSESEVTFQTIEIHLWVLCVAVLIRNLSSEVYLGKNCVLPQGLQLWPESQGR